MTPSTERIHRSTTMNQRKSLGTRGGISCHVYLHTPAHVWFNLFLFVSNIRKQDHFRAWQELATLLSSINNSAFIFSQSFLLSTTCRLIRNSNWFDWYFCNRVLQKPVHVLTAASFPDLPHSIVDINWRKRSGNEAVLTLTLTTNLKTSAYAHMPKSSTHI